MLTSRMRPIGRLRRTESGRELDRSTEPIEESDAKRRRTVDQRKETLLRQPDKISNIGVVYHYATHKLTFASRTVFAAVTIITGDDHCQCLYR